MTDGLGSHDFDYVHAGTPAGMNTSNAARHKQPSCTHDLFAAAAKFGDTAVNALRIVLSCSEAMRATEDLAP
jgi:hypothetical protein